MKKSSIYSRPSRLAITISAFATVVSTPTVFAQAQQGDDNLLEEITITAQRREESLQKSSLAIEVMSAEALQKAGVTQASDITAMTPGVQIGGGGPQPQVYIRGIGDYGANSVSNPAIAFNLDGVYVARSQAIAGNFFDLARMEVLKGPQGTLYGRNASGGAINLIANAPKLGVTEGYAEVGVQNYNGASAEVAINLPLGESIAARVSAQDVSRDGYISDGSNDDKHQSARVQLLYKPSEQFDARLWYSYTKVTGKGGGFVLFDPAGTPEVGRPATPSFDPWTSIASPQANGIIAGANAALNAQRAFTPPTPWLDSFDASRLSQDLEFSNVHAEMNWHMNWATLTVIPAYQSARMGYSVIPALYYATVDDQGTPETSYASSMEARLSNNTDQLKWVVGGFYFDENQHSRSTIDNGFIQRLMIKGSQSTTSYAAFGQATYSVSDPFRVILGMRYTREKKEAIFNRYTLALSADCFVSPICDLDAVPNADGTPGNVTDSAFNYRAGVEYDVAPDSMLFMTVATGFKAGGISQANVEPFKPETLTAFTVGSRNRFLDNSLQVNLEGFYYAYKDHQEFVVAVDRGGKVGAFNLNAGNAKSYGASLDVVWKADRHEQVRVAAEYVQASYDSFDYTQPTFTIAPGSTSCPSAVDPSLGTVNLGGPVPSPVSRLNCAGNQMIRTPKWSGLAGYTYTFDLSNGSKLDAGFDMNYAASRWLTTAFIANVRAPSYTVWNANLTYDTPDGNAQVGLFMHNITDKAVYTGASENTFVGGLVGANIGSPKTYGARLRVKF